MLELDGCKMSAKFRELTCMCETESPESEVGCGVGNTSQAELNGVDSLVDKHLAKVKLKQKKHSVQLFNTVRSQQLIGTNNNK